jgi:hypothetical protein
MPTIFAIAIHHLQFAFLAFPHQMLVQFLSRFHTELVTDYAVFGNVCAKLCRINAGQAMLLQN